MAVYPSPHESSGPAENLLSPEQLSALQQMLTERGSPNILERLPASPTAKLVVGRVMELNRQTRQDFNLLVQISGLGGGLGEVEQLVLQIALDPTAPNRQDALAALADTNPAARHELRRLMQEQLHSRPKEEPVVPPCVSTGPF